jgi:ATP-binding cassette subfamily E protein 1
MFRTDVLNALDVGLLFDRNIYSLSGGELQRVYIVKTLSQIANIYLIDEPSANLDVEQRVGVTKAIKRFTAHYKKTVFVVEHDIMMAMSMGMEVTSRIIVFGTDSENISPEIRSAKASEPQKFNNGINDFLKELNITFRTSKYSRNSRPRINKIGSSKDIEQKSRGIYYE